MSLVLRDDTVCAEEVITMLSTLAAEFSRIPYKLPKVAVCKVHP